MELLIVKICELIRKDMGGLQLKGLAQRFGLSQSYLSRAFKETAGMGLREYLLQLKIKRSKELLLDPSKSIKEIAYELGYTYPSHFSGMFKKRVGLSPTQHRENAGSLSSCADHDCSQKQLTIGQKLG